MGGQAALDEEEVQEPTRLRLEMSADSSSLSGCVVGSYYTRLIGSCPASSATWGDNAHVDALVSFGISAHGGCDEAGTLKRRACFADFTAIAVKPNRVQWDSPAQTVPQSLFAPTQSPPSAPPVQEGYAPPAPGG